MTVFGKILVFMNLVFSVVTGALIVFVFTTRANWQASYEDAKNKAEMAETAYKKEKSAHENDLKQKDEAYKGVEASAGVLTTQVTALREENERLKLAASTQDNLNKTSTTQQQKVEEELKQIKEERALIVAETATLRQSIVNLQKEVDIKHQLAVNSGLEAANLRQRNANLLRELEILTVRIKELESMSVLPGTGGASTGSGTSIVDPPIRQAPAGVRAKITGVGKTGTSLAQINAGSDSGLSPGNVLTVYKGTEYKGDLILTTVQPKTAVGKFTPAKKTTILEKDDDVITSFGPVQ